MGGSGEWGEIVKDLVAGQLKSVSFPELLLRLTAETASN